MQRSCVKWFSFQYPHLRKLLFSVPNGGARNKREAAILKAEGVVSGVADLILMIPSDGYHALCIELKTEKGRQSVAQKQWQSLVEQFGYQYAVVRSITEFVCTINEYLRRND